MTDAPGLLEPAGVDISRRSEHVGVPDRRRGAIRRAARTVLLTFVIVSGAATAAAAAQGPPVGGCPPAGGWTIRFITEPGAPDEADVNGDGLLCGKDVEIPAFPGFDNYIDNVLTITSE
jgi:hypothetical protein